jgi:hypothetical protein
MKIESLYVGVVAAALSLGLPSAAEMEKLALAEGAPAEEAPAAPAVKAKDSKLTKHLMDNIDIFGKSDMPAIYILAPDMGELEGMLLVRDFSRDPFFMQNIDREEFEMKMTLREFDEDDKEKQAENR